MTRLIDADSIPKVLDALCEKCGGYKRNKGECEYCKMDLFGDEVMALPTIDAVPVVHGHWEESVYRGMLVCSKCRIYHIAKGDEYDFTYCPHCGAKMDEVTP